MPSTMSGSTSQALITMLRFIWVFGSFPKKPLATRYVATYASTYIATVYDTSRSLYRRRAKLPITTIRDHYGLFQALKRQFISHFGAALGGDAITKGSDFVGVLGVTRKCLKSFQGSCTGSSTLPTGSSETSCSPAGQFSCQE